MTIAGPRPATDPLRVALDMTFPRRHPASGSSVYAISLATALQDADDIFPLELVGPQSAGVPETLQWLTSGAERSVRAAEARLLHCPTFVAPWRSPVPTVISMHDAAAFLFPADYPLEWRMYNRFVLPRLARRAQGIIAVSEAARTDIARYYRIPVRRISVTYQGVRELYFAPVEPGRVAEISARFRVDDPLLLFVGAPLERKNLQLVLNSMAAAQDGRALSRARLMISGATARDYPKHVARIAASGLSDRVQWLGRVDGDCMPALYAAADLLVYPSLYEGFGLPPLEAMAIGTPVVASAASCLPEILADAALLVDPNDDHAFAEAVESVLTRPDLRRFLVERGRNRAARFRWNACAAATAEVYHRVLGCRARGSPAHAEPRGSSGVAVPGSIGQDRG